MKKFTYWSIECVDDSRCFSVVAKTKTEAIKEYKRRNGEGLASEVSKIEVPYKDTFDLFEFVTGEDGSRFNSAYIVKTYKLTNEEET